jgi:hypothetical protein
VEGFLTLYLTRHPRRSGASTCGHEARAEEYLDLFGKTAIRLRASKLRNARVGIEFRDSVV